MGYSSRRANITLCLAALGGILNDLGLDLDTGAALARAQAALAA